MMQQVFRFLSALVSLYSVVIFLRIIMTWFRGLGDGRPQEILRAITDPYLNWFRANIPVRLGALDFSPLVGILALGVLNSIFAQLAATGAISFGFVLAIILTSVWSVVRFFLTFFLILTAVRLGGILLNADTGGRLWAVIEQFLNPAIQMGVRPLLRGRFTNYRDSLMIFGGEVLAVMLVGRFVMNFLIGLVQQLPF